MGSDDVNFMVKNKRKNGEVEQLYTWSTLQCIWEYSSAPYSIV